MLAREPALLGTLRSNDATATRTSLKKSICVLSVFIAIIPPEPTYFVNCRRTLLKLNFKGPYLSSEREIKFLRCLFTFSFKREIGHFFLRPKNGIEMYKKVWCTCKVVVFLIKPIVFITFSLPSASLDLKVPILAGKRGIRRHSTTSFSKNVKVAETSYQMLKVLSFCDQERV